MHPWPWTDQLSFRLLADRNILIDRTMVNDFRTFKGAMAKVRVDASTGKHCFVATFAEPMASCDHIKERLGQARQQNAQLSSVQVKQVVA